MTKQITERHRCIAGAAILDGKPLCEVCFTPIDNAPNGRVESELVQACRLLLFQYDESGDFAMGGKLTNEPFLRIRKALN